MAIIVFDGDDTLWYVEWLYSQAYADFFSFLYKIFGPSTPNIHFVSKIFFAIESTNAKTWGIRRGRVAESMAETYQKLCEWIHQLSGKEVYREDVERRIRCIGDQPFDIQNHHWVPGAEETLAKLQERGHLLCLLTKYDQKLWPEKAALLGVHRFFLPENVLSVDSRKQPQDFKTLTQKNVQSGTSLFAVGNSEGDLLPVTVFDDWGGFYIPLATTFPLDKDCLPTSISFEPTPYNHPRVITLTSIRELASHL